MLFVFVLTLICSALTFESQVAKESCQKVHNVHDKDGDVGHFLHSRLRWAENQKVA